MYEACRCLRWCCTCCCESFVGVLITTRSVRVGCGIQPRQEDGTQYGSGATAAKGTKSDAAIAATRTAAPTTCLACASFACQHVPGEEGKEGGREGGHEHSSSKRATTTTTAAASASLSLRQSRRATLKDTQKIPQRPRHGARHCPFGLFCLPVRQAEVLFFLFIIILFSGRHTKQHR